VSWSKWGWLLHNIYVPTKNNFNNTRKKNTKQQFTANNYRQPAKEKKANIIYENPGRRCDDGWRNDWRTDQDDSAASHFADRPTRIQKSSRAPDDHTHTSMVRPLRIFRRQRRSTDSRVSFHWHIRLLTRFISDFLRSHTCSLHFTLTDWRPLLRT